MSVHAPRDGSRPRTDPETVVETTVVEAGTRIADRYEIVAPLGSGAMGAVYVARDLASGTDVAIKILHAAHARHPTLPSRFAREAQAAASLRHDNCVPVLDAGNDDTVGRFLVMPRLHGSTLGDWMVGPLDVATTVRWIGQLLDGLAHAHGQGFVHRDIKPDNVFVETTDDGLGRVKILDFGLVKLVNATGTRPLTQIGTVFGTPAYMAPEQASGAEVTAQADLYAVGATMYEMLTGYPRLVAERFSEVLMFHAVPPPIELPDSVPSALADFVRTLMADDPKDRPASAAAAAATLRHLADRDFRVVSALESAPTLLAVASRGWELPAVREPEPAWTLAAVDERPTTVLGSNRPMAWGLGAVAAGLLAGFMSLFAHAVPMAPAVPEVASSQTSAPASPSTFVADASARAPLDPEPDPTVRGDAVRPMPADDPLVDLGLAVEPVPTPAPEPSAVPAAEVVSKPKVTNKAKAKAEPVPAPRTRTRPSTTSPSRPTVRPTPETPETPRVLVSRRPPRTSASTTTTPVPTDRVLRSQRPPR